MGFCGCLLLGHFQVLANVGINGFTLVVLAWPGFGDEEPRETDFCGAGDCDGWME